MRDYSLQWLKDQSQPAEAEGVSGKILRSYQEGVCICPVMNCLREHFYAFWTI